MKLLHKASPVPAAPVVLTVDQKLSAVASALAALRAAGTVFPADVVAWLDSEQVAAALEAQ
ncbi:hypothetical protein AB4851_20835 [Burkholderia sp. 22PA0099]|uniref:hypothetical protein n=1 Tax=Burkholderia sp. 22PA0099 TaxID=3237372 RepID=UPI0039C07133